MSIRFVPLAGAAFALSMAAPALAHHGWGGYSDTEADVTGTVQRVSLAGAHTSMQVRGGDGMIWDIVLSPPYMMFSAGIKATTIPVGATVKAQGHRHRDVTRLEIKAELLTVGGRTFDIYPGRND